MIAKVWNIKYQEDLFDGLLLERFTIFAKHSAKIQMKSKDEKLMKVIKTSRGAHIIVKISF